nr:TipAS antibiotic-recognition domain-containing protein [Rhizomicrobium palustre]
MEAFSNQKCDPEKAAKASRAWAEFYKDLDAVMAKSDPLSDEGLAVARRMAALIQEATGGDRTFWNSAAKFWKEAVHDPRTAPNLPMTKAHYAFLAQSFQELRRRGELQPLS